MDQAPDKTAAGVSSKESSRARLSPPLRRGVLLLALLAACGLAYGIILAQFDLSKGPDETEHGAPASEARVSLYVQPIQIDAVNDSMQVRISVVPSSGATATIADRNFLLKFSAASRSSTCKYGLPNHFPKSPTTSI